MTAMQQPSVSGWMHSDLTDECCDLYDDGESTTHDHRELDILTQLIHDDALQVLSCAAIRLESVGDLSLIPIAEQLRALSRRLRKLLSDLDDSPCELGPDFRGDVQVTAGGLPVQMLMSVTQMPPPASARALRQVVLQAVANATQHASASHLRVWVGTTDTSVIGLVEDDGVGIPTSFLRGGRPGHLGLASMQLWANRVGGSCKITTNARGGTTVRVVLPMRGSPDHRERPRHPNQALFVLHHA
jgi:signal transduction histidine kinase